MSQTFKNEIDDKEAQAILDSMGERAAFYVTVHTKEGRFQFDVISRLDTGLEVAPKEADGIDLSGKVRFDFLWDGTLYEAEANLMALPEEGYELVLTSAIVRVQRRSNFRTSLPREWKKSIYIDQVDHNRVGYEGDIIDISLGGCFFVVDPNEVIEEGSQVYGDLNVHDYDQIRFRAIVRRASQRKGDRAYGIEFIELEANGTQILNNLTLKAARLTRQN